MKPVYILSVFLIFIIGSSTCSFSQINLKKIPSIKANRLLQLDTDTDTATGMSEGNNTEYYDPDKKSSGLSAGSICAIAIPCIAALVGVGAAAAILGGGASAAAAPVLVNPAVSVPPPTYVDTTVAQLTVPQPVQPEIVPPQIVQPEIPPQPIQQVIQPIPKVETPIINIPQQPVVAQPQLVPVQQMQLVPVQQVEMVPVQHVEMVPVQEVVPTYQAAAEAVPQVTQVTQVSQIPQVTEISGAQMGAQGGEFITAPEGYGTSVIQGSSNPLNLGEFSSQNLM